MRRDERGTATVEFALVVPIFLVLVGICAYFAWQAFVEAQLERAAQRAARYAAVPTTDGGYAFRQCDVVDEVNRRLSANAVDSAHVEVRDANGALVQGPCPDGAAVAGTPTGWVRVRVTHTLDNPFADLLTALIGRSEPITLSGSGEARVEDAA
ncbi:MAG TPA: TadE/TadG family type IV pilus assembly protein [Frankiaceae bacterium]|nr:TadE/TadG family type IV pilus assembly protein [Frankiaceae bacterium]